MLEHRSNKKELLDESEIPKELLYQNLKELEIINKYLGGHAVSVNGLNEIIIATLKQATIIGVKPSDLLAKLTSILSLANNIFKISIFPI